MLILSEFSQRNRQRCEAECGFNHDLSSWSLSDWMTALCGEVGESANIIKKLNRHRDGVNEPIPKAELMEMLADELADADIYLDLLYQAAGINREQAILAKFAKTSDKIGYVE